jgi:hypothetical protein
MGKRRPLDAATIAAAALCTIVDGAAVFVLITGPDNVSRCGPGLILPGIAMIFLLTYGTIPLALGAIGVIVAALFPRIRPHTRRLTATLILCTIAWLVVASAATAHPAPSDPIRCAI